MTVVPNRRSMITLFSRPDCPDCHRVRFVLAEKGVSYDVVNVESGAVPEDLAHLNPYGSVPTLVDRELVLYDSRIIIEYLDERFPHPPLMPVDPVSRAQIRLAMFRIEKDWYGSVDQFETKSEKQRTKVRKELRESLIASTPVFAAKPYFLSTEFSVADISICPILWRLPYYEVELPKQAQPILDYAERVFRRSGFVNSLTDAEKDIRR
ncbi:MAG: glutathione S-transferase N-terminal domain-containing protein [Pseudomonadota bacterium]|nr:glutathione S-transferase N-terminal domain-containing protein [Pseudomonadota bacterium]